MSSRSTPTCRSPLTQAEARMRLGPFSTNATGGATVNAIRSIPASAIALALVIFAVPTGAQQFVYPAKGQSAQQQQKDEYECHGWAVQQTGSDPTKAQTTQQAAKPTTTATGTTP